MFHFLAVVHIIASIIMIVFILLQDPKGGAMGMFGGGSSSLFGSTGANNFLLNVTKWTAVIFACTSIYLAALSSQRGTSVMIMFHKPHLLLLPLNQKIHRIQNLYKMKKHQENHHLLISFPIKVFLSYLKIYQTL